MGCHVCIIPLETIGLYVTHRQQKLIEWMQQRDPFDKALECFLLYVIWYHFVTKFSWSTTGLPVCLKRKFWTSKHLCLTFKTHGCQLWNWQTGEREQRQKTNWKTCLTYTCVNKNSNSLRQSMKQAVMKNKQNIIGEWHFITIYGLNCSLF